MFAAQENREQQKIDRVAGQLGIAGAQQMQAQADRTGAITGMVSGLASIEGSTYAGMSGAGKSGTTTTP